MLRSSLRKRKKQYQNLESLEESFEEINELLKIPPLNEDIVDWDTINEGFPESAELESWKATNHTIYSISENNDDEMIDLD